MSERAEQLDREQEEKAERAYQQSAAEELRRLESLRMSQRSTSNIQEKGKVEEETWIQFDDLTYKEMELESELNGLKRSLLGGSTHPYHELFGWKIDQIIYVLIRAVIGHELFLRIRQSNRVAPFLRGGEQEDQEVIDLLDE